MSIQINNFFMDVKEVIDCTSLIDFSADIIDTSFATVSGSQVTTSGSYFTYNGNKVSSNFTSISGGYNISYAVVPSGNIILGLTVANTSYDVLYKEYEFYYGYNVECNEVNYWGMNKLVPISIQASNDVVAPKTTYFSTFFNTHNAYTVDMGVSISPDGSGGANLPVTIRPQSKYFEYGHTYTITVSGIKDFSGNELEFTIFTFTIEE